MWCMEHSRFEFIRASSITIGVMISYGMAFLLTTVLSMHACAAQLSDPSVYYTCSWSGLEMMARAAGYVVIGGLVAFLGTLIDGGLDVRT